MAVCDAMCCIELSPVDVFAFYHGAPILGAKAKGRWHRVVRSCQLEAVSRRLDDCNSIRMAIQSADEG